MSAATASDLLLCERRVYVRESRTDRCDPGVVSCDFTAAAGPVSNLDRPDSEKSERLAVKASLQTQADVRCTGETAACLQC